MRLIVLLLCLGGAACHRAPPPPAAAPADAPATVVSLGLTHTIGGWGDGADYQFTLRATGEARYEGKLRAPRQGIYVGRVADSVRARLFAAAVDERLETAMTQCYDAPQLHIVVRFADGRAAHYDATCQAPDRPNRRLAEQLDAAVDRIAWTRMP
jgi:hypothetical protein